MAKQSHVIKGVGTTKEGAIRDLDAQRNDLVKKITDATKKAPQLEVQKTKYDLNLTLKESIDDESAQMNASFSSLVSWESMLERVNKRINNLADYEKRFSIAETYMLNGKQMKAVVADPKPKPAGMLFERTDPFALPY